MRRFVTVRQPNDDAVVPLCSLKQGWQRGWFRLRSTGTIEGSVDPTGRFVAALFVRPDEPNSAHGVTDQLNYLLGLREALAAPRADQQVLLHLVSIFGREVPHTVQFQIVDLDVRRFHAA